MLAPSDQQLLRQFSVPHAEDDLLLGLRGIHNLGQTCFLSVILQVLVHNPLLRNFFLADLHNQQRCPHRRNVAELKDGGGSQGGKASICLACDVDDLFAAFYSGDHTPFGPQRFLVSMWTHAEHLAGYAQQDAHELYMSLLDGLHHYTRDAGNATSPSGLCSCVVHTVFGGQLRSDVQCSTCSTVSTAVDPMFDISVDLSNAAVGSTLVDCLRRFTQTEKLWKVDQFHCRQCNLYSEATKQLSLHTLPLVLSLHFKRFERTNAKQSSKVDTFIHFPLTALDLAPYLHASLPTPLSPSIKGQGQEADALALAKRAQSPCLYDLLSVVVHKGNLENGHYLCYFRHGSQWYKNDDKVITKAQEQEVSSCQAYILFYLRTGV
jgi:ubiquitin carboxyl-terminal hydrolase 22/27/51